MPIISILIRIQMYRVDWSLSDHYSNGSENRDCLPIVSVNSSHFKTKNRRFWNAISFRSKNQKCFRADLEVYGLTNFEIIFLSSRQKVPIFFKLYDAESWPTPLGSLICFIERAIRFSLWLFKLFFFWSTLVWLGVSPLAIRTRLMADRDNRTHIQFNHSECFVRLIYK